LNVGELETFVPALEAAAALTREGETFVADLAKAGVDRLLGGGTASRPWKVFVKHASKHAGEKVTLLTSPPGAEAPPAAAGSP
jgi:ribosomal protein L15